MLEVSAGMDKNKTMKNIHNICFFFLTIAGFLHTTAMIGPLFGFLLGSLLARLYVDVGFVDPGKMEEELTS